MIQRKQTLFLLLVVAVIIACLCLPIGSFEPKGMGVDTVWFNAGFRTADGIVAHPLPLVDLAVAGVLGMVSIFLYKHRKLQARMCTVGIILCLMWYGYYIFGAKTLGNEGDTFHLAFGACLPFVAIVLFWLARMGIMADEKLVRSMDRIR
jgi:hypothetical protein